MRIDRAVVSVAALTLLAGSALAGPWSQGNLVVLELGPTQNLLTPPALNAVAHAVTLREFAVGTGFTANNLAINSGSTGTRLTMSGSATTEGQMNLTEDGRYLTFAGYDAVQGQPGTIVSPPNSIATTTTANVNRVVGRVAFDQTTDLYRITDAFSTNNVRSATSTNGATFAVAGSGSSTRGLDPSLGTTTTVISSNVGNSRVARYDLGGRLFVSSASGAFQGISEITGGAMVALPGFPTASGPSPQDFEFVSSSLLYVADDRTPANGVAGLQRWAFSAGTWSLQYTIPVTNGLRSIAVTTDSLGNNLIYGIAGGTSAGGVTSLISIVDTGVGSTVNTLATSASGTLFRSVEFVPVPTPGAAALLGLGGLVAARRRR